MKKLVALLLTTVLCLVWFSGCGRESNTVTDASSGSEAAANTVESSAPVSEDTSAAEALNEPEENPTGDDSAGEETVEYFPLEESATLTAWAMWIPGIEQYIDSPMESQVSIEMNKMTNVTVEMSLASSPETAMTEINLLIASGDYPDLINNLGNYYTAGLDAAIEQEIIYNILDLQEYMPNYFDKLIETDSYDQALTDDGNIGAVFQIGTEPDESNTSGMTLRRDWLEAVGLDAPTTYEELHDVLMAFKSAYGCQQALFVTKCGIPDSMFNGFGTGLQYTLNNENGTAPWSYVQTDDGLKVVFGFMDDSFYDVLTLMNAWYDDGLFTTDYLSHNYTVDVSDMIEGESGAVFASQQTINAANTYQAHMYQAYPNISLDGNRIEAYDNTVVLGNQGYSITTSCEDLELAARYLDYQYTDNAFILNNYGVEDVSFSYDANGEAVLTDVVMNNADGIPQAYTQFIYLSVTGSFYCDTARFMSNYCEEAKECIDVWRSAYDYQETPYNTNEIQLNAEEQDTYTKTFSDISTYCNEMIASFITGQTSLTPEKFDEFRENLKDMGIEECTAIYQAAADRYVESVHT